MENNIILNGTEYRFNCILTNESGSMKIDNSIFDELVINESFTNWWIEGHFIYKNQFENFERIKGRVGNKNKEFFYYRMDGSDILTISLMPIIEGDSNKINKAQHDFDTSKLSITIECIIYDSEDITKGLISEKSKKIYFRDIMYNRALNTNERVSSGEYLALQNVTDRNNISNLNKHVTNGNLLKYICVDKLGGQVSDQFFEGANKTLYVSPPTSSIADDINVLKQGWFDKDGFPAYFYFDRYTKLFNLKSYKQLFDNYSTQQREVFHFSDPSKMGSKVLPVRSDLENIYTWPSESTIESYKYDKVSSKDNCKFLNSRSVSLYNSKTKEFIIHGKTGAISNIKKTFETLFDNFPQGNKTAIFTINKSKLVNRNLIEKYTVNPDSVIKDGIMLAFLSNDMISFSALGVSNRTAGTFIEIMSESDSEGVWEDRFLGTWFIVSVKHIFGGGIYKNDILAIKTNMSVASKYPDGVESTSEQQFETVKEK